MNKNLLGLPLAGLLVISVVMVPRAGVAADPGDFTGAEFIKYCNQANIDATRRGEEGPGSVGTLICGEYISGVVQGFKLGQLDMATQVAGVEERYLAELAKEGKAKLPDDEQAAFIERMRSGTHPFCWPTSARGGEMIEIVAKYLKDHPERLDENAAILVSDALHEAYKDTKC